MTNIVAAAATNVYFLRWQSKKSICVLCLIPPACSAEHLTPVSSRTVTILLKMANVNENPFADPFSVSNRDVDTNFT